MCFHNIVLVYATLIFSQHSVNANIFDEDAKLLVSTSQNIHACSLDLFCDTNVPVNISYSTSLDVDWSTKCIYWTQVTVSSSSIMRYCDGFKEEIIQDKEYAEGMAIDAVGRHIYWCDVAKHVIKVSTLDGKYTSVLIKDGLELPKEIVLDLQKGHMYWSDWGMSQISTSAMDGSIVRRLIKNRSINKPRGLTLSLATNELFWFESWLNHIAKCDLHGNNFKIIRTSKADSIFSLAVYNQWLYWTDYKRDKIVKADKDTGEIKTILSEFTEPLSLLITNSSLSQFKKDNACKDGANCQYLCLLTPDGGKRCACPEKYSLAVDGKTCIDETQCLPDENSGLYYNCGQNLKTGNESGCISGYKINVYNPLLCEDIDECKVHACQPNEVCRNTYGSYKCLEVADNTSFKNVSKTKNKDGVEPKILLTSRWTIKVLYINGTEDKGHLLHKNASYDRTAISFIGIDFDWNTRCIYWSEIGTDASFIKRFCPGSETQIVIKTKKNIEGMAVDWIGRNLYWMKNLGSKSVIETATVNGFCRNTLVKGMIQRGRAIALEPYEGYMFWSDWSTQPHIGRAGMDGSKPEVIIKTNIMFANALTISYETKQLYWGDARHDFIDVCDYQGNNRRSIIMNNDFLRHIFSLSIYENWLYWTDWRDNSVVRSDLSGLNITAIYSSLNSQPMNIRIYHPDSQRPLKHDNPCKDGGGCECACLLAPNKAKTCSCSNGYDLNLDGTSCDKIDFDSMLLVTTPYNLLKMSDNGTVVKRTSVKNKVTGIGFDWVTNCTYLSGSYQQSKLTKYSIKKKCPQHQTEIVHARLPDTYEVAIDWIGRILYWTNNAANTIEASTLNGDNRRVIVSEGIDVIGTLVLDPFEHYMYWTDVGTPGIFKAGMDGSSTKIIVNSYIESPYALTICYHSKLLYWADATLDYIAACDFEGNNRATLVNRDPLVGHVVSMTVGERYLYWLDWNTYAVMRADKWTGGNITDIYRANNRPMKIQPSLFYHLKSDFTEVENPCNYNKDCKGLCVLAPNNETACLSDAKPGPTLLLANDWGIFNISLTNKNIKNITSRVSSISDMDYDVKTKCIYWTEGMPPTSVKQWCPQTHKIETILSQIFTINRIAIDWIGRNIYWTNNHHNTIEVTNLMGRYKRVLIDKDLHEPIDIVLNPPKGQMYWIDRGTGLIEKSGMDGSQRKVFADNSLGYPHALTISYETKELFWEDAVMNNIARCSFDEENANPVYLVTKTMHTSSIAVHAGFVYHTNWQIKGLIRTDLNNNYENSTAFYTSDISPKIIRIVPENVDHLVKDDTCTSTCKNLCLITPWKYLHCVEE